MHLNIISCGGDFFQLSCKIEIWIMLKVGLGTILVYIYIRTHIYIDRHMPSFQTVYPDDPAYPPVIGLTSRGCRVRGIKLRGAEHGYLFHPFPRTLSYSEHVS